MTKNTVSAIAVIDLANELLERSIIEEPYLVELGDDFCLLYAAWKDRESIQEQRLPEENLVQLWNQAETNSLNSDLGIDIGAKVNIQSKGILATWLFQCDTLSEAFDIFSTNIALLNPSEYWHKTDHGDQIKLSLIFKNSNYPAIAIDRSMAAMLSWSRFLSKENIVPIRVELSRPCSDRLLAFKSLLGNNLIFNCTDNSIILSKDIFNKKIKSADPYLKSLLSRQALAIKKHVNADYLLTNNVEKLLSKNLAFYCQISVTCNALHLSRSTLFRKLKLENTSFTELVKKSRIHVIKKNVNNKINDTELAELLGFQDSSSYYRFRKLNF